MGKKWSTLIAHSVTNRDCRPTVNFLAISVYLCGVLQATKLRTYGGCLNDFTSSRECKLEGDVRRNRFTREETNVLSNGDESKTIDYDLNIILQVPSVDILFGPPGGLLSLCDN